MTEPKGDRQDTAAVPAVRVCRRFNASREAVFNAWTEPAQLTRWFGPDGIDTPVAEVDLRQGGSYRIEMRVAEGGVYRVSGTYREIQPPERLVFTWVWDNDDGEITGIETLVTIELTALADQTELFLTHERIPIAEQRARHTEGWNSAFDCLERLIESGDSS